MTHFEKKKQQKQSASIFGSSQRTLQKFKACGYQPNKPKKPGWLAFFIVTKSTDDN